jgi:hypothetical protein
MLDAYKQKLEDKKEFHMNINGGQNCCRTVSVEKQAIIKHF